MIYRCLIALLALTLGACSTYQPLKDKSLYSGARRAPAGSGVKVTYFGVTTILISDGKTHLLVDGFFSRPGPVQSLLGNIGPNKRIIKKQLEAAGIKRLDAVLVGHSHHDHALDSAIVAKETGAVVVGTRSYRFIHRGAGKDADQDGLVVVPDEGRVHSFGDFTITFVKSAHVNPHTKIHAKVMDHIHAPVVPPTPVTSYQCGDVYALHIAHKRHGRIAVTTTAGASARQFDGLDAEVVMLGVGLLGKEPVELQNKYWRETVGALRPHTVIPVHWDSFTAKLHKNLRAPSLKKIDDVEKAMDVVKKHRTKKQAMWVMNLRDSFLLKDRRIQ